jgi:xylulokinase
VALGHLTVEEIPALVPVARTYEPEPKNRAIYDELFREFLHLYKTSKSVFGRLNRARTAV